MIRMIRCVITNAFQMLSLRLYILLRYKSYINQKGDWKTFIRINLQKSHILDARLVTECATKSAESKYLEKNVIKK